MNKLKTVAGSAAAFAGRHKKAVIALVLVILAAVAAVLVLGQRRRFAAAASARTTTYIRTVTLQKGSLEDSISATGTVQSAETSNVTTDLKYTVKTVEVQVGDAVEAGDVICTLDTSELESSIQKLTESLAEAKATAQKQYEKAQISLTEAQEDVTDAYDEMAEKESAKNSAQSAYDGAAAIVKPYQTAVDMANAALLTALEEKTRADEALAVARAEAAQAAAEETAPADIGEIAPADDGTGQTAEVVSPSADLSALEDAAATAQKNYEDAQAALQAAQSDLQTAQSASNYNSLSTACTQAQSAYEQAKTAYENAVRTAETAEESRDTALENYNKAGESDELEQLREQLEKCTLKAETAGKVTAVNATVGSAIEGAAATIQNTDNLKIAITIAEYDIDSVSEGMRAVITSDVIDGEISGTLTQISPTASGGGSSSSTFAAEVTVDDAHSGLLVGTNAKVRIIQSTTEDVFTVPLDAIEEQADGTSVIYVRTGEENGEAVFEPVEVVVGATNDYYAEISGIDLEEGMVVRASASVEEATEEAGLPSDMPSDRLMGGGEVVIAVPAEGGGPQGGGGMGGGRPGMGG